MNGILEYLMHTPIVLVPLLLLVAVLIFAILKKLLKVAIILLIAGGLYVLLVRYLGGVLVEPLH